MIIKNINLKNFRNYLSLNLDLENRSNILIGKNAQGKTNLLEAIYMCCVGKSFKGKDKELIKSGEFSSRILIQAEKNYGNYSVEIHISQNENKKILINGVSVQKTGELLGGLNVVYFSPDELKLVKEAPGCRRKFLDIDISQIDKNYFFNLINYNKILLQRNNILKSKNKSLMPMLEIYNSQLAEAGCYIIEQRINFINEIRDNLKYIHSYITDGELIELSYSCSFDISDGIKKGFIKNLENNLEKDLHLGYTAKGPHRDDIKIIADNKDVRIYGSQGQQRTCALSLKLSELEYFKKVTGEYPVLLLDDVFSELDRYRKNKILDYCGLVQTIITSAEVINFNNLNSAVFEVSNGVVTKL